VSDSWQPPNVDRFSEGMEAYHSPLPDSATIDRMLSAVDRLAAESDDLDARMVEWRERALRAEADSRAKDEAIGELLGLAPLVPAGKPSWNGSEWVDLITGKPTGMGQR
jgi:hypothetical protein